MQQRDWIEKLAAEQAAIQREFGTRPAAYCPPEFQQLEGGWRPIETAPKDGTSILCGAKSCMSEIAWWDSGREGWRSRLGAINPTHWRPLPAPPEAAS